MNFFHISFVLNDFKRTGGEIGTTRGSPTGVFIRGMAYALLERYGLFNGDN